MPRMELTELDNAQVGSADPQITQWLPALIEPAHCVLALCMHNVLHNVTGSAAGQVALRCINSINMLLCSMHPSIVS